MAPTDSWKRYLEAGMAFTHLTQERAEALVKRLVKAGELGTEQAQQAINDLLDRSRENTEHLIDVVRTEVRSQLAGLGLAAKTDAAAKTAAKKAGVKKASAAKTPAKKAPAKKTAAKKTAAKKAPAKKAATKTTAKKLPAKKAGATKTAAKKLPATTATIPTTDSGPPERGGDE
jgi:polyhydroxyalkanoate synthesis regulator phasin